MATFLSLVECHDIFYDLYSYSHKLASFPGFPWLQFCSLQKWQAIENSTQRRPENGATSAWERGYSQTCDQSYGCRHFTSYTEFFLTVEDTLDTIEFEDTGKKEMVKPGL